MHLASHGLRIAAFSLGWLARLRMARCTPPVGEAESSSLDYTIRKARLCNKSVTHAYGIKTQGRGASGGCDTRPRPNGAPRLTRRSWAASLASAPDPCAVLPEAASALLRLQALPGALASVLQRRTQPGTPHRAVGRSAHASGLSKRCDDPLAS